MGWVSLISGVVKLAQAITQFLERRQLIDAGKALALQEGLTKFHERVLKAKNTRDNVTHNADSVRKDENNRG